MNVQCVYGERGRSENLPDPSVTDMPMILDNCQRHGTCPLCRSMRIREMGAIKYDGPTLFSTIEVQFKRPAELWQCLSCKSWFVQNIVPEGSAARCYATGSSDSRWATQTFEQEKTVEMVSRISFLLKDGMRVLDVGASGGGFLDFAKANGAITAAVEPSSSCRGVLRQKGHGHYSILEEVPEDRFDLIVAFDLVEHLYDLDGFMVRCAALLSPGGKLVILTGDIGSLGARLSRARWWYVRFPEHIVFPSYQFIRGQRAFQILSWDRTYASRQFCSSVGEAIQALIRGLCAGDYRGLPAPGPDHALMVLRKR